MKPIFLKFDKDYSSTLEPQEFKVFLATFLGVGDKDISQEQLA